MPPASVDRRVAAALAIAAVVTAGCSATASSSPPVADLPAAQRTGDAEDFYFDRGRRAVLRRSPGEIAVQFTSPEPAAHRRAFDRWRPAPRIVSEIASEGRLYYIVAVTEADSTAVDRLLSRLRADESLAFAGAVFSDEATGGRMIPTARLVGRLKEGAGRRDLEAVASRLQLVVEGTLPGASAEYLLRLSDGRSGLTLACARDLWTSGLFEWVQPDFLRELQRGAL